MEHNVQSTAWQSTDGKPVEPPYAPLLETARLYAGWLLAWYGVIFLLAGQHALGRLPLQWDWVNALAQSPLVLRFAFGTFLFLLFSSLHHALRGKTVLGTLLSLLWLGSVTAFALLS